MVALSANFVTKFVPETQISVLPIPLEISCCVCGSARIAAPDGATPETTFTCKTCAEKIWRAELRIIADSDNTKMK